MKRTVSLFCILLLTLSFAACSKGKTIINEPANDAEEINKKYDELFGSSSEDKPIDSGVSVFGDGFSLVDLTFTSSDGTTAFSLNNNSFAKLNNSGAYYNTIAPGGELTTYDAGYKTSRGLGVYDSAKDFMTKYKIEDASALFASSDGTVYYNPTNGNFKGKLTTLFASEDGISYTALTSNDVEKFIYTRNSVADGDYMEPKKIMEKFDGYISLISIDITADTNGNISEVAFYKFDK